MFHIASALKVSLYRYGEMKHKWTSNWIFNRFKSGRPRRTFNSI